MRYKARVLETRVYEVAVEVEGDSYEEAMDRLESGEYDEITSWIDRVIERDPQYDTVQKVG